MPRWNGSETHKERVQREIEVALEVLSNGGFVCIGHLQEGWRGPAYWLEPGGKQILTDTFSVVKNLAQLRPCDDGLVPGFPQTWRPLRMWRAS
jgi:hypothetical protein